MKILLVSDFYHPMIGGTELHVRNLGKYLTDRGHEVKVVTTSAPSEGYDVVDGLPVFRFNHLFSIFNQFYTDTRFKYIAPFPDPLILRNLVKIAKQYTPDIIHAHGWIIFTIAKLKEKLPGIPMVATAHDYGFACANRTLYTKERGGLCPEIKMGKTPSWLTCIKCSQSMYGTCKAFAVVSLLKTSIRLLSNLDRVIAVSTYVFNVAKIVGIKKIKVIPNFVNYNEIQNIAHNLHLEKKVDLIYVGSFDPIKGTDVLLTSFQNLKNRGINVKLEIIVKSVPHKVDIPENVQVFTDLPHEQVLAHIRHSKIVIIPSVCPETMSSVALEAMSLSKPIIASKIGGNLDLVEDSKTGVLVPPGNHKKLTEAIIFLLENPVIRKKMGANGLKRLMQYFSSEKVIPKIEELYKMLISNYQLAS